MRSVVLIALGLAIYGDSRIDLVIAGSKADNDPIHS